MSAVVVVYLHLETLGAMGLIELANDGGKDIHQFDHEAYVLK